MCMISGEFPANELWTKHKGLMCRSARARFATAQSSSTSTNVDALAENEILRSVATHLEAQGKSLAMFELPEPASIVIDAIGRYHAENHPSKYADLASVAQQPIRTWMPQSGWTAGAGMTSEQASIFDSVLDAARARRPHCQMISARAGRGKTWLMNLVVAVARSEGIVTLSIQPSCTNTRVLYEY
jgi:hypothetical protein